MSAQSRKQFRKSEKADTEILNNGLSEVADAAPMPPFKVFLCLR